MERESTHKKEEFYQILAHETTHAILAYTCKENYYKLPHWFKEGFSGLIAKQYIKNEELVRPPAIFNLLDIKDKKLWAQYGNPYHTSYLFIYYLSQNYAKNLKNLILSLKSEDDFHECFGKIFGDSL